MGTEGTFKADTQLCETCKPRVSAFNDPLMSAPLLAFNVFACDSRCDATTLELCAAPPTVISLVRMQLLRTFAWAPVEPVHRRYGLQRWLERNRFMSVRVGDCDSQRYAPCVYDEMALAAEFASICGVKSCFLAPRWLDTFALSTLSRLQSIWSCSRKRVSIARRSCSHTPQSCYSRSRHQHVIPEPKPSSCGRSSQNTPVCSIYKMPLKAARFEFFRGRPLFVSRITAAIKGSSVAYTSSLTFRLVMDHKI